MAAINITAGLTELTNDVLSPPQQNQQEITALLSQAICDENPSTASIPLFQLAGQSLSSFAGFNQGSFSFGDGFDSVLGSAGSGCSQYQFTQNTGNPYSWQQNTTFSPLANVLAIDLFGADGSPALH